MISGEAEWWILRIPIRHPPHTASKLPPVLISDHNDIMRVYEFIIYLSNVVDLQMVSLQIFFFPFLFVYLNTAVSPKLSG